MLDLLAEFIARHQRILVLTGAGVSTASGIPEYRDDNGNWKHQKPVEYRDFVQRYEMRQRYWARSYLGWPRFSQARPNRAHIVLAELERLGRVHRLITQNVDGLHYRAGSRRVTELHGSLAQVVCLGCNKRIPRGQMQRHLLADNPQLGQLCAEPAPDGDAKLSDFDLSAIEVPVCACCGGLLKPEVVFFGETIPRHSIQETSSALLAADAMLVVGSSLMVYSGYRWVREAVGRGIPVAAINRGKTRADSLLEFRLAADCGATLAQLFDLQSAKLA